MCLQHRSLALLTALLNKEQPAEPKAFSKVLRVYFHVWQVNSFKGKKVVTETAGGVWT